MFTLGASSINSKAALIAETFDRTKVCEVLKISLRTLIFHGSYSYNVLLC